MKTRKKRKCVKAILSTVTALTVTLSLAGIPVMTSMVPVQTLSVYAEEQAEPLSNYSVTVTGGELSDGKTSGTVEVAKLVTVKANTAPAGRKFSHWERNGVKVSSNTTYSFYMPGYDISLEAVFAADTSTVTSTGTAIIESVTPDKSTGKVSFVSLLNVPKNCTYVKGGLVATSNSSIGENVNVSNAAYVKLSTKGTSRTKNLKYTWTKGGMNADTVWYVKGYLVYRNADGTEQTVYSDCVAANIDGIVEQTAQENGVFLDKQTNTLTIKGAVTDIDIKNFDYGDDYSPHSVKKIYAEKGSSLTGSMYSVFIRCYYVEEIDLSNLDTSGITDMDHMFAYLERVKKINLHGIDTSNVISMHWMFYDCVSLEELDITGWDTSNVEDMEYLFAYNHKLPAIDVDNLDFSSVKTMLCAFYECNSITELDLSKSNMSNLENACLVASRCENLKTVKFGNSTTSKLDNAASLFYNCPLLKNVDVSQLNTSSVTNMNGMFQSCTGLESVDISSFDTGSVTDMGAMFRDCTKLSSVNISGLNTSEVKSMYDMFRDCPELKSIDVSSFNTSKAVDMSGMFRNCSSLKNLDVSSFNTVNVTNMAYMFSGCTVLQYVDLSGFNYNQIKKYDNYSTMFVDSPYLTDNVVSVYKTQLKNGYTATFSAYITVKDNAARAVVSIGDQSQEFSRSEWNLSSGSQGAIAFDFKSNATTSSDKFKIRFYDAEDRPLPVMDVSYKYCSYAEFTHSSSDVTRTYFRVTKVVGDEISYTEYNSTNKMITLNSSFLGSSTVPDGCKLSGWKVNNTFYPLSQNYNYWTGGRDTTITAVFVEKPVRETIVLSLNTSVTAHYEDGDSDTLSFTASEAGTYVFTSENAYQMTGLLYDAETNTLIASDAYSIRNSDFRIKVDLAANQTVYMKNSEYYGVTKIYDYTVSVRKMSDTPVSMKALTLNTTVTGKYTDIDEYNVFSFTAAEDGVYLFTAVNIEDGISGVLYSDAMLSNSLASKSDSEGSIRIRASLTAGQTVYFKPEAYYYSDSCDYTVSVTKKVIVEANTVVLSLNKSATGSFNDLDDFDKFSFTAEEDGVYIFKGHSDCELDSSYSALYSDSMLTEKISDLELNWGDYGHDYTVKVDLKAGDKVYLWIKPFNEDDGCTYTASVKKWEQNFTLSVLTLDTPTAGRFESIDEFDYFSFTAEEDGTYIFTSSSNTDTEGYLYSDSNLTQQISYNDDGNGYSQFRIEYSLKVGQTVYLKPVEYNQDGSCSYTVTVSKKS